MLKQHNQMIRRLLLSTLLFLVLISLLSYDYNDKEGPVSKTPNILLVVADDLGYADLGCYGGDIATPNIDRIAEQGIRFSRFHTSPFCAPSRAMLLSGNDNHIAGMGSQDLVTDQFGYEGRLSDRIATIPQILRNAGYQTYIAGKWHLGFSPEASPDQNGFDYSFVNLFGEGNHYNDQGWEEVKPVTRYSENGKPAKWENGKYSTNLYTDKLIQHIDQYRNPEQPFFAMASYTSLHWPLQVDEKYWKKYQGKYDEGYEKLKQKRFDNLKRMGIIPQNAELPPSHAKIKAWDSLTLEEKKSESKKMELYAGMVDNLDYNVGRLLDYLKDIGEYENTIIVFMSDNGAAGEDFYHNELYGPYVQKYFSNAYDRMGKANSFVSYGPQWAEAGAAPFKYYKSFTTEGGMNSPMIISGPGIEGQDKFNHEFITIMDLAPTFYDIAKTSYPLRFLGREIYPLKGASLLPLATGSTFPVHGPSYVFGFEHRNYAMLRKGDWKITNLNKPLDKKNFKLYNLSNDLAEQHDLKDIEGNKYHELLNEWDKFAREIKVQVPTPSSK